jgi:hypothetical protein
MPSTNPVQRRLDLLQDQWTQFVSNPQARLLRWVVAPDEVAMVAALWARESDERAAETPDLLLCLRAGFEDPERHGFALRGEFLQELMRAQEALGEESRRPRWTCPGPLAGASDAQAFVAALEAFRAAHVPAGGVVGVWLDPNPAEPEPRGLPGLQAPDPGLQVKQFLEPGVWSLESLPSCARLRHEGTKELAVPILGRR